MAVKVVLVPMGRWLALPVVVVKPGVTLLQQIHLARVGQMLPAAPAIMVTIMVGIHGLEVVLYMVGPEGEA
jgi:hypothetical protein